ncbi:MAG: hypothetical protein HY875_15630 [Chloroflexi bacterium]|nr:hypothetical protein [Chloroflexota bacterium]
MSGRSYPADPADAGFRLFLRWFGAHYARSTKLSSGEWGGPVARGTVQVGRRWDLAFAIVNTLAPDASLDWEAARAAIEQRLDDAGRSLALWVPRDAALPVDEPRVEELLAAAAGARSLEDGRLEVRRPVTLHLRRTSTTGSVVTALGGMAPHWAQFTNRVAGSFQLNSLQLHRLPADDDERTELADRIVLAAGQPEVDGSIPIASEDAWSANDLEEGGSCVLGTPARDDDEQAAALRRNLRKLLKEAAPARDIPAAAHALVVLGASTYAEEEKLTWALRGMDPTLYAGFDIIAVVADGIVKPLLTPPAQSLPWDVPSA